MVPAWWIKDLNDGKSTENKPRNGYKVVEVAWGPPTKYLASHIPGALYLNTNDIEEEPLWNHVSDKDLKHVIENLGITSDTTVILYGRNNLAAARAAVLMMYAGVKDVRLLNGGWKAWMNAGYPVESFMNEAEPVTFDEKYPPNLTSLLICRKHANTPTTRVHIHWSVYGPWMSTPVKPVAMIIFHPKDGSLALNGVMPALALTILTIT